MRKIACSLLALLLLSAPAAAQSITIPTKVQVDAPGLVVIRATAVDADAVAFYDLTPGLQTFPSDVVAPKPGTYLGFALQAGTYKIGVVCAKAGKDGKAALSVPQVIVVTVGAPPPPPTPIPPGPGPTPPAPAVKTFWVLAVTDKAAPSDAASKALMLASLRKSLADAGHTLRWYDQAQDYAKTLGKFVTRAGGLPALIILEKGGPQDGRVVAAVRLPADEAGVLKAVRDAGGK